MKKTITLLLFSAFILIRCFSCANYFYALDNEGKPVFLGYDWRYPFDKNFNIERNIAKLKKLEQKLKKDKNYMLLSDYAVGLMKIGKPKEALEILAELYRHYPNDYKIAANLGTAYELNGKADSALKYIKRDMALNPNDHEGSEWVHLKILEAKLELSRNPLWLEKHSVLNLTEKQKKDSAVLEHITIQMQERIPFTPGPTSDEIMASVLTDLADISANIRSIEYARAYYQMAKKYYGGKSASLDQKIKEMEKLLKKYSAVKPKPNPNLEGSQGRFSPFKYQELLKDNDKNHYKVNWAEINTDVNSLLAYADFTITAIQIRSSEKVTDGVKTEELKLIPEHIDSPKNTDSAKLVKAEKVTETKKRNNRVYVAVILIIIVLGFFIKKNYF